jgi:ribosomal protein S18 acetylase RimI-like enzyme
MPARDATPDLDRWMPPEHGGCLPKLDPSTPASALEPAVLAALLSEVYSDYPVPMQVNEGVLAFMVEAFDLDLDASPVAWRDGRPVGVALLGVRGDQGWVGGMGVVPAARRARLGEGLMHELIGAARARGVRTLRLEVLESNAAARALYVKLGFRDTRRLEVWAWTGEPPAGARLARAEAPAEARRRIAAARSAPEPWQRADETVDRLDVSTPALRAVGVPGGDAVYRVTDGRASVLQLHAAGEAEAGVLLDTIRLRDGVRSLRFLNLVAGTPAAAALRARGATCEVTQVEMALEIAPPAADESFVGRLPARAPHR